MKINTKKQKKKVRKSSKTKIVEILTQKSVMRNVVVITGKARSKR